MSIRQHLYSHHLDPARPMSMHGPLHGCSARPNLEASEGNIPMGSGDE